MATYPFINAVTSTVVEDLIQPEQVAPNPNAVLIMGTANKGPLYSPVRIDKINAREIFGTSLTGDARRFSLLKGFDEITGFMPGVDVIGLRIGAASRSKNDFYSYGSSGEVALSVRAYDYGANGNTINISFNGDTTGIFESDYYSVQPTVMEVEIGSDVYTYSIDPAVTTTFDLAETINNFHGDVVVADSNPLTVTKTITIEQTSGEIIGTPTRSYSLTNDIGTPYNVLNIVSAYSEDSYIDDDSIKSGASSATLALVPIKDNNPFTSTISAFRTVVRNRTEAASVAPGTSTVTLSCASDTRWDVYSVDASISSLTISIKTASYTYVIPSDYWSVNEITGVVTFTGSYAAGGTTLLTIGEITAGYDVIASYNYLTTYTESPVRSQLSIGNKYSYFVAGSNIIFGAAQTNDVIVEYNTKGQYVVAAGGEVSMTSANVLTFANYLDISVGDQITVEFVAIPSLPAISGAAIPGSTNIQTSSLVGGSDGTNYNTNNLELYYTELQKGFIAADQLALKIVVPQGVYIDDTMQGIDPETGLTVTVNAGFAGILSAYLARHGQYVSECVGIISTKPMTTNPNILVDGEEYARINKWVDTLVNTSSTDTTRPANVVNGISDYRLICTTGDLVLNTGGTLYVEGGHNILAAMKFHHANTNSLTTRIVPKGGVVQRVLNPISNMAQLNSINQSRYTLFTQDGETGDIRLASAPTLASPQSQFRKQFNVDVTFEAINRVRRVLKNFIGEQNTPTIRQAMKLRANQVLQEMSPDMLISGIAEVTATRAQAINGKTEVHLNLVTAVEISQINITTRLQLGS